MPYTTVSELIDAYYANEDLEVLAACALIIAPDAAAGFYDNSLDAEEFIAALWS